MKKSEFGQSMVISTEFAAVSMIGQPAAGLGGTWSLLFGCPVTYQSFFSVQEAIR